MFEAEPQEATAKAAQRAARRAFLAKAGGAALAAPIAASLVVAAHSKPAMAKSRYGGGHTHKPKKHKPKKQKKKGWKRR